MLFRPWVHAQRLCSLACKRGANPVLVAQPLDDASILPTVRRQETARSGSGWRKVHRGARIEACKSLRRLGFVGGRQKSAACEGMVQNVPE